MVLRKDMWRIGVARAPITGLLAPGALAGCEVAWLPEPADLRFMADPFGLWRDGRLHVFVETYDYRDRVGAIEVLTLDDDFAVAERRPALREPWHLSYPFVVEAEGETWMLPEAFRSGRLTLYRAVEFPHRWEAVQALELDRVAIDATPVFHDGLWWLFYSPAGTRAEKMGALHVAWAEKLTGPWTAHPGNPVRTDMASSRPGGTPLVVDGALVLPVQDCSRTYGGAIRPLTITTLTPDRFEAQAGAAIVAPASFAPYVEGLHTLSAAGAVTLIDAKRGLADLKSLAYDARRAWRKAAAGWR